MSLPPCQSTHSLEKHITDGHFPLPIFPEILDQTPHLWADLLGAKGSIATRITYLLKVGYEARAFSGIDSETDSLVTEAGLTYSFAERSAVTLAYSRRNNVSIQDPGVVYLTDSVSARLTHPFGPARKFEAGIGISYVINSYDGTIYNQRVDNEMRINFDIVYKMKTWLSAKLGYEFEHFESSFRGVRNYDANQSSCR